MGIVPYILGYVGGKTVYSVSPDTWAAISIAVTWTVALILVALFVALQRRQIAKVRSALHRPDQDTQDTETGTED